MRRFIVTHISSVAVSANDLIKVQLMIPVASAFLGAISG